MAKVPPSSGTLLNEGTLELSGLRILSTELFRDIRPGLFVGSNPSSFLRCFMRSIPFWPLSRVKDRRASNRFRYLKIPCMKTLFSKYRSALDFSFS